MRRGGKVLLVIAVLLIGLGGYGMFHASGIGNGKIVDGVVVEVKEHVGTRKTCVINGRKSNKCITLNAEEPYGYATEVVEYLGPDGQPVRAEDLRERGGDRDSVGDEVKVLVNPDGTVEVLAKNGMVISAMVLAGGIALLALLLLADRSRQPDPVGAR